MSISENVNDEETGERYDDDDNSSCLHFKAERMTITAFFSLSHTHTLTLILIKIDALAYFNTNSTNNQRAFEHLFRHVCTVCVYIIATLAMKLALALEAADLLHFFFVAFVLFLLHFNEKVPSCRMHSFNVFYFLLFTFFLL